MSGRLAMHGDTWVLDTGASEAGKLAAAITVEQ